MQNEHLRRSVRFAVAIVALLAAFVITVTKSQGEWQFGWNSNSLLASPEVEEGEYDLSSIVVLNRVLLQLQENYVEAERFEPRFMLASGLDAIQKAHPEIVATFDRALGDGPNEVRLQVGDGEKTFTFGDIESLWEMSLKFKEIFRFIQDNVTAEVDPKEIEYAAINGLLKTLDPHSILLSPDIYRDMLEGNRGNFGGLGIVIRMIEGKLTVIKNMGPDTPAGAAGLERNDVIVQIGDQSTLNMDVSDAVELLRGQPGTPVDLSIARSGADWDAPKVFTLERAEIKIPSVESAWLGSDIGYIKLTGFQGNTHSDMVEQLDAMEEEHGDLKGLVLDLRGNPGGLLDQAIEITNEFVDSGEIVTTVGSGKRYRKPYTADADGTREHYPIVVLVDPKSASASEIVAGALKNHDRALIVGDTSFGKGSVQVLYELQDGSALKLTIAQYLTPGDVSIQSVGIVPDIKLVPMTVKPGGFDMYLQRWVRREATLRSHLDHDSAVSGGVPSVVFKYVAEVETPEPEPAVATESEPVAAAGADDDRAAEPQVQKPAGERAGTADEADEDDEADDAEDAELDAPEESAGPADNPQVQVAIDLLEAAGSTWNRPELLEKLEPTIAALNLREDKRLTDALGLLDVDWSGGESTAPTLAVAVTTQAADDAFDSGDTVELTVAVTNHGDAAVHRVYALTDGSQSRFEDQEFIFGTIAPGATVSRTQSIKLSSASSSRLDEVSAHVFVDTGSESDDAVDTASLEIVTRGPERPHFAFAYAVLDSDGGNGDGVAQVGETVTVRVIAENTGEGEARKPLAWIKNLNAGAVFLDHARERSEPIPAGAQRSFDFTFRVVREPEDGDSLTFEVHVDDNALNRAVDGEITVPFGEARTSVELARRATLTADATTLLAAPLAEAPAVATAPAGAEFTARRESNGWLLLESGSLTGWVEKGKAELADGEPAIATPLQLDYARFAPRVELETESMVTEDATVRLSGTAVDDGELRDLFVFVYSETDHVFESRKVAYQRLGASTGTFEIAVPLNQGMNRIKVVTRDDDELEVSESVYVFRR